MTNSVQSLLKNLLGSYIKLHGRFLEWSEYFLTISVYLRIWSGSSITTVSCHLICAFSNYINCLFWMLYFGVCLSCQLSSIIFVNGTLRLSIDVVMTNLMAVAEMHNIHFICTFWSLKLCQFYRFNVI